jgi:hypothetical protein
MSGEIEPKLKLKKQSGTSLRENSKEKFKDVIGKLGIDEFYTKSDRKQKKYNKFIAGIVPEANWNYMSDLIELPTTSEKYKWLLVVIDLATNLFDIEPMKNKEASTTLQGFKNIIKRKILLMPEVSLKTDGGTEFKGSFNKYISDHGIWHSTAHPYHKKQMAPVEGMNRVIGRLLMNYLNDKTLESGLDYFNWTDILPQIRTEVNRYRKRDLKKLTKYQKENYFDIDVAGEPDYKVGQYVHFKLDRPVDILGNVQNDGKWRMGDRKYSVETRKIVDVIGYPTPPYYRYKLQDMPHVSYSLYDLKLSKNQGDDTFIVRKVIDKRVVNKKNQFLVWFKGYLKKDAMWLDEKQLIEDGVKDEIDEYLEEAKKKPKKK